MRILFTSIVAPANLLTAISWSEKVLGSPSSALPSNRFQIPRSSRRELRVFTAVIYIENGVFVSLLANPLYEMYHHPVLFDQDFGQGLTMRDLLQPPFHMRSGSFFPPWKHCSGEHGVASEFHLDKDKDSFKALIDVQHFAPDEITVTVADDHVVVKAKHEEKKDEHGYVSRQFLRHYKLPDGVKEEAVTSSISSDGVLCVTAPMSHTLESAIARLVPVTVTAIPAAMRVAHHP